MNARNSRLSIVVWATCAVTLVLGSASAALAAGPGYGSGGPGGTPPTGFTSIVAVKTVGSNGGSLTGKTSGGTVKVTVPQGAETELIDVAITGGSKPTVKRDLASALKKYKIIAVFGVEFKHGSSNVGTSKKATVAFKDSRVGKHDIVAVYNPGTGKFLKAQATVVEGKITIRLSAGESIVVLS
jgi:hypothetical protein